jgi:hypothetical protein
MQSGSRLKNSKRPSVRSLGISMGSTNCSDQLSRSLLTPLKSSEKVRQLKSPRQHCRTLSLRWTLTRTMSNIFCLRLTSKSTKLWRKDIAAERSMEKSRKATTMIHSGFLHPLTSFLRMRDSSYYSLSRTSDALQKSISTSAVRTNHANDYIYPIYPMPCFKGQSFSVGLRRIDRLRICSSLNTIPMATIESSTFGQKRFAGSLCTSTVRASGRPATPALPPSPSEAFK